MLEEQIRKLIDEKEYVDFLVGRNGEFDQCVSSTVLRVRKNYRDDNSSLVLMLPYPTAEYINNQNYYEDYYSDIEISYAASKAHPKAAIQIRNREINIKVIQDVLGHADISTTMDIYCDVTNELKKKEFTSLGEFFKDKQI
ncbi:MAG: hypothetical protein IJN56_06115 [Clostridia bacterium]|nr:hypothetical protein [Clostridia bacterium]